MTIGSVDPTSFCISKSCNKYNSTKFISTSYHVHLTTWLVLSLISSMLSSQLKAYHGRDKHTDNGHPKHAELLILLLSRHFFNGLSNCHYTPLADSGLQRIIIFFLICTSIINS